MALFGRKKPEAESTGTVANGAGENGANGSADEFQPDPAKAKKWFSHARAAADTGIHEYALWCYASGIRFDPEEMAPHEAMYESAVAFLNKGGKPAPGKEIRQLEGPRPVDKFAAAEYAWMRDLTNSTAAMRLLETTVNLGQHEFGRWLAPRLLNVLRRQKKPSKSDFLKAMGLLGEVGAWDQAIAAGEDAQRLDPNDSDLAATLKNLSAQRAMDQGGYAQAGGQEGGFRKFIRDEDRQRELEEAEAISGGATIEERNLARAKAEYEANPQSPDAIHKYAQLVKKKGTPEAEEEAYRLYSTGFEATGEYRFRALAGDIRIAQAERRVRELEEKTKAAPDDEAARSRLKEARETALKLKAEEYRERTEKYPTDRKLKFQRGEVEFALGNVEDAMACFQAAKEDPRLRVAAGHLLGLCFARDGWHDVAVGELKEALENIDASERDRELDVRYDLMVSLTEYARDERSLESAKEALEICSSIARKNITYRDIRARRKEIDTLIRELGAGGGEGASDGESGGDAA